MRRRFFAAASLMSALLALPLFIVPLDSSPRILHLPRGIDLIVRPTPTGPRVGFTRWHKETPRWFDHRPPGSVISVTGDTVTITDNGNTLTSPRIDASFEAWDVHGLRRESGATTVTPSTRRAGAMATRLVPWTTF